jgi:hypothetical protein
MDANIKKLIEWILPKSTREIVEDHVKEIIINVEAKNITLLIDRTYALNQLSSADHIWNLIKWVKKSFWNESETILKTKCHTLKGEKKEHHDREINVPHTIHYK